MSGVARQLRPVLGLHTRTVLSTPPVAISRPSGLNATHVTGPSCRSNFENRPAVLLCAPPTSCRPRPAACLAQQRPCSQAARPRVQNAFLGDRLQVPLADRAVLPGRQQRVAGDGQRHAGHGPVMARQPQRLRPAGSTDHTQMLCVGTAGGDAPCRPARSPRSGCCRPARGAGGCSDPRRPPRAARPCPAGQPDRTGRRPLRRRGRSPLARPGRSCR